MLLSIQFLRSVAVIMVIFYHAYLIGKDSNYVGIPVLEDYSEPGKFGVNLFFVLSGFIIFFAHSKDLGRPERIGDYLYKRFSRIYPVYWIFLSLYIFAAYFGLGSADFSWETGNLVSSSLLWGGYEGLTLPLKVAWTLIYEILFYLVFVVFLLNKRLGVVIFLLWALLVVVCNFLEQGPIGIRILELWNLYFIAGGILWLLYTSRLRFPRWLSFSGMCLSLVCFIYISGSVDYSFRPLDAANSPYILLMIFPLFILIFSLLQFEKIFSARFFVPFVYIGNASYTIYLTHSAVISLFYIVVRKLGFNNVSYEVAVIYYFMASACSLLAGLFAYELVEKPTVRLFRNYYNQLVRG